MSQLPADRDGPSRGDGRALSAIFLAAIALRPQLVGLGPLAPEISRDLGIEHAGVGLLTTIPLACMGVAALVVAALVARVGARSAMAGCLAVVVAVGVLRALAPDSTSILLLTLPIGIAIGLAGSILPVVVKERLHHRPAAATGVYSTAIQLGSTLSAALAVPLALQLGGWRGALLGFAAAGAASLAAWMLLVDARGGQGRAAGRVARPRLPWRDPVAWLLAMVFWLSAFPFYGLFAWLASTYIEMGWSSIDAGWLVSLVGLAGLPASLLVGGTADRMGSRRAYLVGSSVLLIVAMAGFVMLPDLGVVWALLGGSMLGAAFTLALLLPLDVAPTPLTAGALVAMELSVGYILTAATPVLLGAARDLTGSFAASMWLNVVASVLLLLVTLPFSATRIGGWRARYAERPP